MAELIDVTLIVPEEIKAGLVSGLYERVGGVVRMASGKKTIVKWLGEAGVGVKGAALSVKVAAFAPIAIAAATFLYMQKQFSDIKKQLEGVHLKLDAQNISKLQSGFKLAAEAEKMKNAEGAAAQILEARCLLEEGANIFRAISEGLKKEDKQYVYKSYGALKLVIVSQLAIIRTYLWNKEYEIANERLLALQSVVMSNCLYYIKRSCDADVSWYDGLLFLLFLPILPFCDYSDESKMLKHIDKLEKSNKRLEHKLQKVFREIHKKKLKIPEEILALENFSDYLKGYGIELHSMKKGGPARLPLVGAF